MLTRKHPRLRGEDVDAGHGRDRFAETPPLTRGRPGTASLWCGTNRNTPAYAGKTLRSQTQRYRGGKHPRLRGEDSMSKVDKNLVTRNTPAYAGKTFLFLAEGLLEWKHPRLRGEDNESQTSARNAKETPPLTRGRPQGVTTCLLSFSKHPRLRGEDKKLLSRLNSLRETPPLTRGRQGHASPSKDGNRNTPAYAGKTLFAFPASSSCQKHPRLRGEDSNILYEDKPHNTKYAVIN